MLDSVLDAVVSALRAGDLNVFREFPERRADLKTGVSVSVGIDSCKYLSLGMGEYLGTRTGTGGSADTELFGRRLELELRFEIYSPFGTVFGASGCVRCVDSLRTSFEKLPSGIRVLEMDCGEICADDKLSAFKCECKLRCLAFMVAENDGNENEFLDYVLKGTVDSGN